MTTSIRLGHTAARRGSLLVVIMGLVLILLGMTVAVSVRIGAGMNDAELVQRYAQSFLMMEAVKTYADVRFAQVAAKAPSDPYYTSVLTALTANNLDLIKPYDGTNRAMTGGDGGDGGSTVMSAMTQSATAGGLGPLANRMGWFHVVETATAGQVYVIAAGGGGGTDASGAEQAKRKSTTMHGGTLGAADPRDSYDAMTYYRMTLPTASSSASVVVQPTAGRSSTAVIMVESSTKPPIWGKK